MAFYGNPTLLTFKTMSMDLKTDKCYLSFHVQLPFSFRELSSDSGDLVK